MVKSKKGGSRKEVVRMIICSFIISKLEIIGSGEGGVRVNFSLFHYKFTAAAILRLCKKLPLLNHSLAIIFVTLGICLPTCMVGSLRGALKMIQGNNI